MIADPLSAADLKRCESVLPATLVREGEREARTGCALMEFANRRLASGLFGRESDSRLQLADPESGQRKLKTPHEFWHEFEETRGAGPSVPS
jgi:hypothetical protein